MSKEEKDKWDDTSSSAPDGLSEGLTQRYKVHFPRTADQAPHKNLRNAKEFTQKYTHEVTNKYRERTVWDWAVALLPMLGWLRTYDIKGWLLIDVAAGLSVAAMVVPQGLSYAKLAGLPSVWGLYGSFVPCIIYGAFGSSRQLAVGPVAVTSLLLGNTQHGLGHLAGVTFPASVINPDTNKTVAYSPNSPGIYDFEQTQINNAAHNVAFLVGIMYTGIGLLRLGWITQYLSQPVISGFMTGASVTIAMSQVKYLMGLNVPRYDKLQSTLKVLADNLTLFSWREWLMGMSFLVILEIFKYVGRKHRRLFFLRALGPITVTILSIAIMNIFKLYQPGKGGPNGISSIGHIPRGLPGYTGDKFFPFVGSVGETLGLSIVVCLVDLTESISIARALAQKNRYELQPTQELLAIGYANIAGSLFNSYTTTGSFSRSAVNNSCGAKTPLATMISGFAVMIVLLSLTGVFTNMSNNAQGAIIISGVVTLFDLKEGIFLFKTNKLDFVVWVACWFGTMFAGVEIGIAIGVGCSMLLVLLKIGFPHTATLGRLPGTHVFRNIRQYTEASTIPGILIVRVDAPFYFASVHNIREMFTRYTKRAETEAVGAGGRLQYIIIDMSSTADIDATAVHYLFDFVQTNRERRRVDPATNLEGPGPITVILANPSKQVVRQMEHANLVSYIRPENIFVHTSDAVSYAESQMLSHSRTAESDEA